MNDLKDKIFKAAVPPEPLRKEEFLRGFPREYLTFSRFVLMQIGFVRKSIWAAALLFMLAAVLVVRYGETVFTESDSFYAVWVISALSPFFALAVVCGLYTSDIYGMTEIENACCFGKGQLAAARIMITGVISFFAVTAAVLAAGLFTAPGVGRAAAYILAPYCISSGVFMEIMDRVRNRSGIDLCAGGAVITAAFGIYARTFPIGVYAAAVLLGAAVMAVNTLKFVKKGDLIGAYN